MSAGEFVVQAKYAASYDTDNIHPITVQPETLELEINTISGTPTSVGNDQPGGAVNNPISAVTSLTRRQRGLKPRFVTIRFTETPSGYKDGATIPLPWLNRATFDSFQPGAVAAYLGKPCVVVAKEPERAR